MSDTSLLEGGAALPEPNTYNPIFSVSMSPGTPVCQSTATADEVVPAKADTSATSYCVGVVIRNAAAGGRGGIRYAGPVTLQSWAAALDTGTLLTQGLPYYISQATAGKLTHTKPVSGLVTPVGYALSPTTLFVFPSYPTTVSG